MSGWKLAANEMPAVDRLAPWYFCWGPSFKEPVILNCFIGLGGRMHFSDDQGSWENEGITHWQPVVLPEIPKEP